MKNIAKSVLVAASLLLSAGPGFAAEVKSPSPDVKSAVRSAGEGVKADAKASAGAVKENANGKAADAKASAKTKLVDINTATQAELRAIPGIGDVYAGKIAAGRPYANKTQLKSRKIMPAALYEQVKEQLIAKQPQK